jgi:LysR family transcriptional regulator (chromosome initiation inhibitor)
MTACFGEAVPVSTHFVPSYEGYNACCLNGTGWGMVPRAEGIALAKLGELVELNPGKTVKVSLHWQTSTQSSATLLRLGEIVQEEAKGRLYPDRFRPY